MVKEANNEDKVALDKYRDLLIEMEAKSQNQFDAAVLSLSGGALGLTFSFVDKIVPFQQANCKCLLFCAWTSWCISVMAILASFFFSQRAFRYAIGQVDKEVIHVEKPGGFFDWVTSSLNLVSGLLFFAGMIFITLFVAQNVK